MYSVWNRCVLLFAVSQAIPSKFVFADLPNVPSKQVLAEPPKIVCFYGFWSQYLNRIMRYTPADIPARLCDILIYAFVTINSTSYEIMHRARDIDIDARGFAQAVALKKENPNLKVILSVGGQPYAGVGELAHYSDMLRLVARREVFVQSAIKFLQEFGFDGLELQWYYPGASERDWYRRLVKELNKAFKPFNYSLMITAPFYRPEIDAGFNLTELKRYVDYFNVRTVGMNAFDKKHVDNSSPLRRRSFDVAGEDENVESVLEIYTESGVPKSQLIFGIPFESHVFVLENAQRDYLKAPSTGVNPKAIFYYEVCARIQSGKWLPKRDIASCIPYAVQNETSQWVSYDDEITLSEKVCFARKNGLGGMFVWLTENDDFRGLCGEKHALLNIIKRQMDAPCLNMKLCE